MMEFVFKNCTNRVATILMGFSEQVGTIQGHKEYMGRDKDYDVILRVYDDILDMKFYNGAYMIPMTQISCKGKMVLIPNNEYVSINIM